MTVVARRIVACPVRSACDVWSLIVDLLAPDSGSSARQELLGVAGIASLLIGDEALEKAPCTIYGSGPRVRVYCLYGEDAISGETANEAALASCPTEGEWRMSLPCPAEDLEWVQKALSARSTRITARDMMAPVDTEAEETAAQRLVVVDKEAFLRP